MRSFSFFILESERASKTEPRGRTLNFKDESKYAAGKAVSWREDGQCRRFCFQKRFRSIPCPFSFTHSAERTRCQTTTQTFSLRPIAFFVFLRHNKITDVTLRL